MREIIKNKKIFILVTSLVIILSATFIFAENYVPLEQGAFNALGVENTSDLGSFLSSVFNFGIAAAVVLAFIMLVYAGVIMMTTDSWSKKDDAKTIIENALYGLGLALISWLILYTINPCLVYFSSKDCNNTFLNPPKSVQTTSIIDNIKPSTDTIKKSLEQISDPNVDTSGIVPGTKPIPMI